MKLTKCDRCGVDQKNPHVLTLIKDIETKYSTLSRDYTFSLCDKCARNLFGWIGGAKMDEEV